MRLNASMRRFRSASRFLLCYLPASPLLVLLVLHPGCTVSQKPRDPDKILVEKSAPVFDKRFESLSYEDLDLSRLWVEKPNNDASGNLAYAD